MIKITFTFVKNNAIRDKTHAQACALTLEQHLRKL